MYTEGITSYNCWWLHLCVRTSILNVLGVTQHFLCTTLDERVNPGLTCSWKNLCLRIKSVFSRTHNTCYTRSQKVYSYDLASSLPAHKKCFALNKHTFSTRCSKSVVFFMTVFLSAHKLWFALRTVSLHSALQVCNCWWPSSLSAYKKCSARHNTFSTQEHKYETVNGFIFGCAQIVFRSGHSTFSTQCMENALQLQAAGRVGFWRPPLSGWRNIVCTYSGIGRLLARFCFSPSGFAGLLLGWRLAGAVFSMDFEYF